MRLVAGPAGGAYSASPAGPLAGLKGKEREGEWGRGKGRASRGTPGDAKCVTEILRGTQIVGGTKFKFGQLIFRKIIKIVATRCHILRLKWTKFDFVLRPRPRWGSSQRSLKPLAGFKGSYF